MSPHPSKDEFARRLSVKHDQLLKDLTEDLELGTAQIASAKQVLDARLKAFRAALETGPPQGRVCFSRTTSPKRCRTSWPSDQLMRRSRG